MKNKKIIVALFFLPLLSCKRNLKTEGPNLEDLYGEFKILQPFQVSSGTVDFSTGESVHFTCKFNKPSDWTLTITGPNKAKKILTGKSNTLDLNNAVWNGTTTHFPTFSTGLCDAELFVKADSSYHKLKVQVNGKKKPGGQVVADFETGIQSGWKVFAQTGANMSFLIRDTGIIPEGGKYYDMGGAVNWDWLIGMIDFPASAYGTGGFKLGGNPDDLYFNVVINRPANLTNGIVLFQFREDENSDGLFNTNNEDMYSIELNNLKPGWQIYSIKYSELVCLVNGSPSTPKGNGRFDADKLFQISCLFLANPSSGYSKVGMDYIVFTQGKPLEL